MPSVTQPSTQVRTRMTAPLRREQLLDVTADIVADQGFVAVSVQSVARQAGVSRPIVYQHFGDLPGLLTALVGREMRRALLQVSETQLRNLSEGDPIELMLESLATYLAVVQQHPTTWRLVLMPPEGAPEILRKSISSGRAAVLESLTDAVRPASLPGDQSPEPDSEMTARILSAIADEYARLVLSDPDRFPPERLLRHARWWLGQVTT